MAHNDDDDSDAGDDDVVKDYVKPPSTSLHPLPLVAHLPWNNKTPPDLRKSLTLSLKFCFPWEEIWFALKYDIWSEGDDWT